MKITKNKTKLRKYCEPIPFYDSLIVASKMHRFMLANKDISNNSIGLASNQLGLNGRVILVKFNNKWKSFINPQFCYKSVVKIDSYESCLSLPKIRRKIERSSHIVIIFEHDHKGDNYTEHDYFALDSCVIQHEIDHLDGILISDKGGVYDNQ